MAENKQDAIDSTKTEPVTIVPPNTHTSPTTRESIAPREIAAGTVRVAGQPTPTKIDPVRVGVMENPVVSPQPSGCRIVAHSPLDSSRDTTGRE